MKQFKVGDVVQFKDTHIDQGPSDLIGKARQGPHTVQCVHGERMYIFKSDDPRFSFNRGVQCSEHDDNYWVIETDWVTLLKKTKPVAPKKLNEEILDKLILDSDAKNEIVAVLKQHQHSVKLFTDWGLDEVIKYGKGMTFLFYGSPGTGKTWAAHCMAEATGRELLSVSAAEIQSQIPGEANRNIQQAFASSRDKVLFIDECDSLIMSRHGQGMVLSSEINTLLTEIEKFEGICILATNRVDELDEALERRISLIVEFPEPKFEQRLDIWKTLIPKKMPLAKDVVIETLSEYKLTGGQIKNCILQAARLAIAEDQKNVSMPYFEAAIKRINHSKSLLGTASRYRQERIMQVVSAVTKKDAPIQPHKDTLS